MARFLEFFEQREKHVSQLAIELRHLPRQNLFPCSQRLGLHDSQTPLNVEKDKPKVSQERAISFDLMLQPVVLGRFAIALHQVHVISVKTE